MKQIDPIKMLFKLEQDEYGFPPVGWESMWATPLGNDNFEIDNIPFYVRGISCGDVVTANLSDTGEFLFGALIQPSENSTIRVYVSSESEAMFFISALVAFGCECERSNITKLFAVHIPSSCELKPILELLAQAETEGKLEYEEAAIRQ